MDKRMMLNMLQSYYGINKDVDFGSLLGVSSQVLSNWKTRNTFDAELIYTKCVDINAEWLLMGYGEMLKKDGKEESSDKNDIIDQLRKENSLLKENNELLKFKIATLEQRLTQDKSVTVLRSTIVERVSE